jgi:hypothetical protein
MVVFSLAGCYKDSSNSDLNEVKDIQVQESSSNSFDGNENSKFSYNYPESSTIIQSEMVDLGKGSERYETIVELESGNRVIITNSIREIGYDMTGERVELEPINIEGFEDLGNLGQIYDEGGNFYIYKYQSLENPNFFKGSIEFVLFGNEADLEDFEYIIESLEYIK